MPVDHATDIRRTLTGVVLGALIIAVLAVRGWPLLFVILIVCALGLWEFFTLFWGPRGRIPSRLCAIALGWGMLILSWMHRPQDALVCLGAGFVLASMSFLFRWDVIEEDAFSSSGIFMAGLAYVPLLLLPATYLSSVKLLFVLAAVAISDTAAYFVGTRFGHHKLWPRVSPNKSSEGAVGSLVACILFCVIYGACLGSASLFAFALLGIAINAFAQVGDLFESALKRSVNVKDSGHLLPATAACWTGRTACFLPCPCLPWWISGSSFSEAGSAVPRDAHDMNDTDRPGLPHSRPDSLSVPFLAVFMSSLPLVFPTGAPSSSGSAIPQEQPPSAAR